MEAALVEAAPHEVTQGQVAFREFAVFQFSELELACSLGIFLVKTAMSEGEFPCFQAAEFAVDEIAVFEGQLFQLTPLQVEIAESFLCDG